MWERRMKDCSCSLQPLVAWEGNVRNHRAGRKISYLFEGQICKSRQGCKKKVTSSGNLFTWLAWFNIFVSIILKIRASYVLNLYYSVNKFINLSALILEKGVEFVYASKNWRPSYPNINSNTLPLQQLQFLNQNKK